MRFLARQKFFFDLGAGFMQVVNFAFICVAAAPTLQKMIPLPLPALLALLVVTGVLSVWAIGRLLDHFQFQRHYLAEQNQRNDMLQKAAKL